MIYAIVGIAGAYEVSRPNRRSAGDAAPETAHEQRLRDRELSLLQQLYPGRRETNKQLGLRYLSAVQLELAIEHFERALAADPKDEELLHAYAFALSLANRDPNQVADAVARWRRNFPYSNMADPTAEARNSPP